MDNVIEDMSEAPSRLEMFVSELQNQGKSEFRGYLKAISVRLPLHQFAAIEAFSRHTGMSKNKVVVGLIEVCLNDAITSLDKVNRKAFLAHQSDVLEEIRAEGYGESAGEL